MYKYFDFDLNVKLDSAQVTYDDNGNVTSSAADEAFDWTEKNTTGKANHDVTGAVSSATEATIGDAVVTWTETATVNP